MTQLPVGPPTKPFTELTPEGIQRIKDRLSLVLDTRGFDDSMAPVVRNIVEALITQDLPALLADLDAPECEDCASIHRVHHVGRVP
jgi:hypothetical protein